MFKTASIVASTIACAQAASDVSVAHGNDGVETASDSHVAGVSESNSDTFDKGKFKESIAGQWGRSYDSVKAQSFTDEQYVRGVEADDDSWAVDYDRWENEEKASKEAGASSTEVKDGAKDAVFKKPKGVTDIVNTQAVSPHGHYLDAFPALPTIPINPSPGYGQTTTGYGQTTTGYGQTNTGYGQVNTGYGQ